jgi:hypothetical protein
MARSRIMHPILPVLVVALMLTASPLVLTSSTSPPATNPSVVAPTHVVVIVLENRNLNTVYGASCGSNCSYITQLANTYGIAMNFSGVGHWSLTNYLTLTSGANYSTYAGPCAFGTNMFTCDCSPSSCHVNGTNTNIADKIEQSGRTWRAYIEDYIKTGGCTYTNAAGGRINPLGNKTEYDDNHNPFLYYQDIAGWNQQTQNVTRCANIVNANGDATGYLALPKLLIADLNRPSPPNLIWLAPNNCNNGHDYNTTNCHVTNPLIEQNNYLKALVPAILNSSTFQTTPSALFITWDEGKICAKGHAFPSCVDPVATILAGSAVKQSYKSSNSYSHYSFIATLESLWSLSQLPLPSTVSPIPALEFFNPYYGGGGGGGGSRIL